MAFGGDSTVGLLFTIGADSSAATKEISDFRKTVDKEVGAIEAKGKNAFTDFAQGLGVSAEQTAALSTALPVAGAAIGSFAAVVAGAGAALFGLAKSFSDYGSAIKDASDKTGLSAESLSTLKLAADESGSSLEAISGSVTKFSKLIGSAAEGSKSATASLVRLGIDPKTGIDDLDGSLEKVFKRIYEAQNPIVATKLATEAFGKSGADLIPVIKQMDGDFAAFKKRAEELGVVLSGDDVKAADDFGDQLTELQTVARSVANTFAKEFTSDITKAMGSIEQLLIQNKGAFKEWGQYVSDIIRGISTPEVNLPQPPEKSGGLLGERPSWFPSDEKIVNFLLDNSATGGIARTLSGENAAKRGKDLREREETQAQYDDENVRAGISDSFDKTTKKIKTAADDLNNGVKSAGNKTKSALDSFDKQFREVAKEFGFSVERTFGKSLNEGSLHPSGNAGDLRVGGKTNEQSFEVIAALLEKHFRVIDERVVGAFKGIHSTAPNIHAEHGQGIKPSLFLDASRYGGEDNLAYLKKLDADRLNKKTSGDDVKKYAEERKRDLEKQAKDEDDKRKDRIKAIEDDNKRFNDLDAAETQTELKELDSKLAQKLIKEDEYTRQVGAIKLRGLEVERAQTEELSTNKDTSAAEAEELQNKLKILDEQITQQKIENADKTREGVKSVNDEYKKQIEILNDLKREVLKSERDVQDFRKEQERKGLENTVDFSRGKARLDALVVLRGFEIAETERHRAEALKDADADEEADKAKFKGLKNEKELVEQITQDYANRRDIINGTADDQNEKTDKEFKPAINQQQAKNDGGAFFGTIAAGIADYLKNVELVKNANGELEFSFGKLFDTVGEIGLQAFTSLAQGFGTMVGNWVLYGNTGGQTLRKLTATILSQVASIATSYAVISLGAAALSTTAFGAALLGGTPGQFLAAAAIFGGIALGSALAGRAAAGNSFSQNSASSSSFKSQTAAGASSGSNQQQTGQGTPGGYYSSNADVRTREEDRLRTSPQKQVVEYRHVVEIQSKDNHIISVIKDNVNSKAEIHGLILKVAGDA